MKIAAILLFVKSTGWTQKIRKPVLNKKTLKRPIEPPDNSELATKKKKIEDEKPKESNESVEEHPKQADGDGHFELNELTTQVLEEELQAIMIKVWQCLPDNPQTESERFVAERLRNETSDELRNVLGLNVTKRLLNVFNPLYVKIQFSCRPESGCLTEFINTYNIKNFKRTNKDRNLFAARMPSITDFDRICSTRNIRCGSARIIVTPCYRFNHCPSNLNTIFTNKTKMAVDEVTNNEKDAIEKTAIQPSPVNKKEQSDEKEKVDLEISKPINRNDQDPKTEVESNPKASINKEPVPNEIVTKVNQNKEISDKVVAKVNKPTTPKKSEAEIIVHKSDIEKVKDVEMASIKQIEQKKEKKQLQNIVKNENLNTSEQVAKTNNSNQVKKELVASKQVTAAQILNPDIVKKKINHQNIAVTKLNKKETAANQITVTSETAKKSSPNVTKKETDKANTTLVKIAKPISKNRIKPDISPRKQVTNTKRILMEDIGEIDSEKFDESDEMDDEEILALISGGVIVDECSGSD